MTDKHELSEQDICTQYILPALIEAGWDIRRQVREQVYFTDGRIYVKGEQTQRGKAKKADYVLYYKPNIAIAIIEAKKNTFSVGAGMQQALDYADILDLPVAFSSNGDGFLEHDKSGLSDVIERELSLDDFPSPDELWQKYKKFKGIETTEAEQIASFDYFFDSKGRQPRYYQQIAINRTVEAIAKGQDRLLLVMATGSGKTYTAFQIIHRLWKNGTKKRILFLADRTSLISQTKRGDFKHFKNKMTVIKNKNIDTAFEIYLALYQGLVNYEDDILDAYREFSPDFFDLIVIDECHRGSAAEDSKWREILEYFSSATHVGLTATPKETKEISNIEYFGDPIYTYSLKQGIDDGFLAPYKVIRVGLNVDLEGYRPEVGKRDKFGDAVDDRLYNLKDFDRNLVIDDRTKAVAKRVMEYLRKTDVYAKTIIFCVDTEHAERMRQAISNEAGDLVRENYKYVMRITGENKLGKLELGNFTNPEERYPVIATTSKLLTTGVDAQTCKLIVLDSNIQSPTEFKQIIGRGTRVNEQFDKRYFTIMDFRNVTDQFSDRGFDGDPVMIKEVREGVELTDEDISGIPTERVIDQATGEVLNFGTDAQPVPFIPTIISGGNVISEPRDKVYVTGVNVEILNERIQYLNDNGDLVTASLKDYTKQNLLRKFSSLDDFLSSWDEADKKSALIAELSDQGIVLEDLQKSIQKDLDLFDLICYVAWGQPPLTRKERADNVRKRNCFAKYGVAVRSVLDTLLEKYATDGIENIEELSVLKLEPMKKYGSPKQIIDLFGGKSRYLEVLRDLKSELYQAA